MMYVALPIKREGNILAVVRTSVPVTAINEALKGIYNKIILAVVVIGILAAVVSLFISRRISQPIGQLTETAKRFASGQLSHRAPISRTTELAELAEALNEMARQLYERINSSFCETCISDAS